MHSCKIFSTKSVFKIYGHKNYDSRTRDSVFVHSFGSALTLSQSTIKPTFMNGFGKICDTNFWCCLVLTINLLVSGPLLKFFRFMFRCLQKSPGAMADIQCCGYVDVQVSKLLNCVCLVNYLYLPVLECHKKKISRQFNVLAM